jgi:hypothetical protein
MCILIANNLLAVPTTSTMSEAVELNWASSITHALLSRSVIYYLGWYTVFSLLIASNAERSATTLDVLFLVLLFLFNFASTLATNWLVITVAASYMCMRDQEDIRLSGAGVVLLALAFNGFWGPKLFSFFAYPLLRLDAALVGSALILTQPGTEWYATVVGRPHGHSLLIFGPCSSFHNISLGLLCWVSITKLIRASCVRADILPVALVFAVVILINAGRLYLMALNPEYYTFWHEGFGERLAAWVMTAAVLLISLWGAINLGREG